MAAAGEQGSMNIAIFTSTYLTPSMTFIYRQMKALSVYNPIVVTRKTANLDYFPHDAVFPVPEPGILRTYANRMYRRFLYRPASFEEAFVGKVIEEHDIRLIHAHFAPDGVDMLFYKKMFGIPLVTTFHGYDMSSYPRKARHIRRLEKLFQEGDLFVAVSDHIKNQAVKIGCPPEKIVVLYIGVPLDAFTFTPRSPVGNGKIRLLQISNFVEKKGIFYTVKAFAKIAKQYPNVELRLVGDGVLRNSIERLVEELNLAGRVSMPGCVRHTRIPDEMAASHILLHPSVTASNGDTEGLPIVLKEAQAVGLPVISTYHAGIPELVIDGKTGFLVPERDVEALYKKMQFLITNQDSWLEMGRAARKRVEERFDLYRQTEALESIYDSLIVKQ